RPPHSLKPARPLSLATPGRSAASKRNTSRSFGSPKNSYRTTARFRPTPSQASPAWSQHSKKQESGSANLAQNPASSTTSTHPRIARWYRYRATPQSDPPPRPCGAARRHRAVQVSSLPFTQGVAYGLMCGARKRLGVDSSERDDMIGVDDDVLAGFGLDEPCKLHDRPASGVEDDLFDVLGISLDAVALSGDDRYLRDRSHGWSGGSLAFMCDWLAGRS